MKYSREYMIKTFKSEVSKFYQADECVRFLKDDKDLMRLWKKSADLQSFLHAVETSQDLKWSTFALYWFGTIKNDWFYRRSYCAKFATEFHKTTSDVGALKIGVNGMKLLISNRYGDGLNRVAIFDHDPGHVSWLFPYGGDIIKGKAINVYEYDCGENVICTLSGSYVIYSDDRFFALVKYSD